MNTFDFLIGICIGFCIGRIYPSIKKFGKFIDKEKKEKENQV